MSEYAEEWASLWGARYDFAALKDTSVREAIGAIALPGESPVIADYGCGAFPISRMYRPQPGQTPCYAFIDIAADELPDDSEQELADQMAFTSATSILIEGDVDQMARGLPPAREANRLFRKFLSAHSSDGKPFADLAVLSEILNYVDHKRVLTFATRHLRTGGTLFIVNEAMHGMLDLFSNRGLMNDFGLADLLETDFGYEVTSEAVGRARFSTVGAVILTAIKN